MMSILMLDTNVKSCQFMSWGLSLHLSYCQLRCPLCGDFPLVSHIVSSGVHMCCPVKPWNAMSSHDKPCQVMSWRLSPHFSYCQLRCVLCGNFPLVSHIVSSGVHFVAIFPSFLILSAQVCTCAVIDTTFFNMNLDSSSTPLNSDSGFCLFF